MINHARRKSEESDENLVNLFGSENTPQDGRKMKVVRDPSATNVMITDDDSGSREGPSDRHPRNDVQMALSKNV